MVVTVTGWGVDLSDTTCLCGELLGCWTCFSSETLKGLLQNSLGVLLPYFFWFLNSIISIITKTILNILNLIYVLILNVLYIFTAEFPPAFSEISQVFLRTRNVHFIQTTKKRGFPRCST